MSAPRKKKKLNSLYDQFYGTTSQYEQQVNKAMKSVEEQMQEYALQIDAMLKKNQRNANAPTSHTKTMKTDIEKLRDTIRKGAKNETTRQKTQPKQPQFPTISDVVRVKDLTQFTSDTYRVDVALKPANYYSEQITTKVVGMEQVDWWEYVLIYGIVKYFRIGLEYVKLKEYIDKGIQSTRTVSGQNLEIKFIPIIKNDVKQEYDTVNGQTVIREKGTVYESATISLEIPQKSKPQTQEYRRGYFVYEDSFSTLVIDKDALHDQIDKMLADRGIHLTLIEEIKKILNDGRLSTI